MINIATHYPAVLEVSHTSGRGSAVLLEGGRFILTAAHLVASADQPEQLRLRSLDLNVLPAITAIHIHPDWDASSFNNDLALLELATPISGINGLALYRDPLPIGETFIMAGFGNGTGTAQHIGTNSLDTTGEVLNGPYNRDIPANSQFLSDYDNGSAAQNMLASLTGVSSSALPTSAESISLPGDSGGPALLNGQVAGIASYIIADPTYDSDPDNVSSTGEVAAYSNINSYLNWIDYTSQGNPVYQPPSQPADVSTTVAEPDFGSVINHFLLTLNSASSQSITLWYQTIEGSALAGQDYEASEGWLTLAPGETQLSIPVSILGDRQSEADETFSLQISDPSNQWLAQGITLIASHTITDNDTLIS